MGLLNQKQITVIFICVFLIFSIPDATAQTEVRDHRGGSFNDQGNERDQRGRRKQQEIIILSPGQKIVLINGKSVRRRRDTSIEVTGVNGRINQKFLQGDIFRDNADNVVIITRTQRFLIGGFSLIEREDVAGEPRESETEIHLDEDQRIILKNGESVKRSNKGTVRVLTDTGRSRHTLRDAIIVRDGRGDITVISGQRRVRAGVFQSIEIVSVQRDNRENAAGSTLRLGERWLLTSGRAVQRETDGRINVFVPQGRIVRSFKSGTVIKGEKGQVGVKSGGRTALLGTFRAVEIISRQRDQSTGSGSAERDAPTPRRAERIIILRAGATLELANGDKIERLTNGNVNIVSMNGRVVRTFKKGKILKDQNNQIIISAENERHSFGLLGLKP